MNIKLALMTGVDIAIPECQLVVHQPKLKEIALLNEEVFFSGVQCLNINKRMYGVQDESLLQNTSNFQIFMTAMSDKRMQNKRVDMEQALSLICPNYKVMILPSGLILSNETETCHIDEENFDVFQDVIAQIFCIKPGMGSSFNPRDQRSAEIAAKLEKARSKVAKEKGNQEDGSLTTYISCLAVSQHIPVTAVSEYTIFQLYDQLERYGLRVPWELDILSRLAGGKPDDRPENWMKNIH